MSGEQLTAEEARALLATEALAIDTIDRMDAITREKYQQGPWWDAILKLRSIASLPSSGSGRGTAG